MKKWLMLLAFLLANVCAAETGENLPTRDELIKLLTQPGSLRQITLSPDGKHFAAVVTVDGKEVLGILRRDRMEVVSKMSFRGDEVVDRIRWANNERVLVTNAIKLSRLDQKIKTGELYAVNVDGKRGKQLFGYRMQQSGRASRVPTAASHDVLSLKTEDPNEILIGVYSWSDHEDGGVSYVANLNIHNGRVGNVIRAPVRDARFIADKEGNIKFAVGADKNNVEQFFIRDTEKQEWRQISNNEAGYEFIPIGYDQVQQLAYGLSREEADTLGIYHYDARTGEKKLLYRNERIDPRFEDLQFSPDGELLWIDIADGRRETHYVNPHHSLSALHKGLVNAFPGQLVELTSMTADGKELLVYVHAANDPGVYFLVNTETRKADFLVEPAKHIQPSMLADVQPIRFKARDDVEINGYLTKPKHAKMPVPMVVLIHGGPHQPGTEVRWEYDPEVQIFASQGYAVLQVNFRGSYGFGENYQTSGYRQWGRLMQNDVTDATKWAIAEGIADPNRIGIYGASHGGYSAMMGLITAPELYRCGIMFVGVSDLALMHEEGDIPERRSGRAYLDEVIGNDIDELEQWSPAHRAAEIQAPVFILHGGKDDRVPIEHAERLEKALKKAGKSVETLYYPFETHGFHDHEHRIEAYKRMLAFFDKHLLAQ
ncbi:alpha/beta hydrolase family protein [Permianibacter aggregans]|uniref:Dipeptidyl aminopeptidase/acylaminoacyl peptidase n=1 Tax=Permianibacter aggregans TaxID=1510150 RepID=A0A4R6UHA3_9GAMM|nr:S9 family peptidase [Permianibacter aggregans]TDQ46230.1 dipeptidyl aminopeptidase/acylaminoacyl peptidase [Permianibacter aggregans]